MLDLFDRVKKMEYKLIGSYSEDDVKFLLKDLSGQIEEQGTEEREGYIQSGRHYSEMIPIEYKPSEKYLDLFYESLEKDKKKIAKAVAIVSELLYKKNDSNMVLVSLARAGTPAGILIKRYLKYKYSIDLHHYSISIIRGKGIDENALLYILSKHSGVNIQFIDGWTGKGAILVELEKACQEFKKKYNIVLDSSLAVIADPGKCVDLYGTREDFLLPSACLNSTVSGLISRTILRSDLINEYDFHGAKFYKDLIKDDVSNFFIDSIVNNFGKFTLAENDFKREATIKPLGLDEVLKIKAEFNIDDINFIKPGVGETTRVLLRRVPWKILVKNFNDINLRHILLLAKEKEVEIVKFPLLCYQCCGIIKPLRR